MNQLTLCEEAWLMKFNVSKCYPMRGIRHPPSSKQIIYDYTLHIQILWNLSSAKYVGVNIMDDLDVVQHINEFKSKAAKKGKRKVQ